MRLWWGCCGLAVVLACGEVADDDDDDDDVVQCSGSGDCNDGFSCTSDACVDGTCDFTPDNAACDDGAFCNGAEFCNPDNAAARSDGCYTVAVNPPADDDPTDCVVPGACDESSDSFPDVTATPGTGCEDGDGWTAPDICAGGGVCQSGDVWFIVSQEQFDAATAGSEVIVETFERLASGAPASPGFYVVGGGVFFEHDKVTFSSHRASNQTLGVDTSAQLVLEVGKGVNANTRSSLGSGSQSGVDAIQANFSTPVVAVGVLLGQQDVDFEVTVTGAEHEITYVLPVDAGPFFGIITEGDATIQSVRVVPGILNPDTTPNTDSWYLYDVYFSK